MFYLDEEEKESLLDEINLEDMIKASILDSLLANKDFQSNNPEFYQGLKDMVEDMLLRYLPINKVLQ